MNLQNQNDQNNTRDDKTAPSLPVDILTVHLPEQTDQYRLGSSPSVPPDEELSLTENQSSRPTPSAPTNELPTFTLQGALTVGLPNQDITPSDPVDDTLSSTENRCSTRDDSVDETIPSLPRDILTVHLPDETDQGRLGSSPSAPTDGTTSVIPTFQGELTVDLPSQDSTPSAPVDDTLSSLQYGALTVNLDSMSATTDDDTLHDVNRGSSTLTHNVPTSSHSSASYGESRLGHQATTSTFPLWVPDVPPPDRSDGLPPSYVSIFGPLTNNATSDFPHIEPPQAPQQRSPFAGFSMATLAARPARRQVPRTTTFDAFRLHSLSRYPPPQNRQRFAPSAPTAPLRQQSPYQRNYHSQPYTYDTTNVTFTPTAPLAGFDLARWQDRPQRRNPSPQRNVPVTCSESPIPSSSLPTMTGTPSRTFDTTNVNITPNAPMAGFDLSRFQTWPRQPERRRRVESPSRTIGVTSTAPSHTFDTTNVTVTPNAPMAGFDLSRFQARSQRSAKRQENGESGTIV